MSDEAVEPVTAFYHVLPSLPSGVTLHRLFVHMTDSVVSSSPETRFPCPFDEEIVWPRYWKLQGVFRMRILDSQQLNQICLYFQEASLRRQQGQNRRSMYRFPVSDLARYFGIKCDALQKAVFRSNEYKEFVSRSSAQQADSTAQQTNSTDCLRLANPIIENEPCDAEADGTPSYNGDKAVPDCSTEQARVSPLPDEVVRAIESEQWPEKLSSIVRNNKTLYVEQDDLQDMGYTVLEDFPCPRSDMCPFREAIENKGACFIRGRLLALRVANDTSVLRSKHSEIFDEFYAFLCAEDDKRIFEEDEEELHGTGDSYGDEIARE